MGGITVPVSRGQGLTIAELLMRQGEPAARAAQQSGAIWGRAAENIGNIVGGAYQQHQERKGQERTSAAFNEILSDQALMEKPQQAFMRMAGLIGPERSAQVFDALGRYTKLQQELKTAGRLDPKQAIDALPSLVRGFMASPEESRGDLYPALRSIAVTANLDPEGRLPEQYDPKIVDPLAKSLLEGFAPPKLVPVTTTDPEGRTVTTMQPEAPGLVTQEQEPLSLERISAEAGAKREPIAESAARAGAEAGARAAALPESLTRRFTPRQVNVDGKDIMANYDSTSGLYFHPDTGEVLKEVGPMGGAIQRNRKKAAQTSLQVGGELINYIEDPKFAEEIGLAMGRYNSLAAAAGAGNARAQYLVGAIKSFAALQPQIHGFRAYGMAEDIEKLLNIKQDPEALISALRGVLHASYAVAEEEMPEEGGDDLQNFANDLSRLTPEQLEALGVF